MRRSLVALLTMATAACGNDGDLLGAVHTDAGAGPGLEAGPAVVLPTEYLIGADITWTQQDEAGGATFADDDGGVKPILQLLQDHGFNWVRLRTFVDPTQPAPNPEGGTFAPYSTQGFADLAHTIPFGHAIKAAGLGFLLDFHCSDYWADPGKQIKPSAWLSDDLPAMTAHLRAYTEDAVRQLVAAGARPDMVQIGNSITPGFELSPGTPLGSAASWANLAALAQAGIDGVRAVDPTIAVMLHIDRCADDAASIAWVENARTNGLRFDVLGESCYVAFQGQPAGWQRTLGAVAAAFPDLKVVVAEYNGDANAVREITTTNDIVFGLPNRQGLGAFFWEPTHTGAWGPGLFTAQGNRYSTVSAAIDQFDVMRTAYSR